MAQNKTYEETAEMLLLWTAFQVSEVNMWCRGELGFYSHELVKEQLRWHHADEKHIVSYARHL